MSWAAPILAAAIGLCLALYPVALTGPHQRMVLLAALGLLALALGIARPPSPFGAVAAGILAAEYGVALIAEGGPADHLAPVAAVLWFLLLELLDVNEANRTGAVAERAVLLGGASRVLAVAIGTGLAGTLAMLTRLVIRDFGVVATVIGAVSVVITLAVPIWLANRVVFGSGDETGEPPKAADRPGTTPARSSGTW